MKIKVSIYSCYKRTYSLIYKKILKLIYGDSFDCNNAEIEIIDTSEGKERNIQSQRRVTNDSIYRGRIINIYEDGVLKHIVGISNTNYDEDRKHEFVKGKSNKEKLQYGGSSYHANTYLIQGINQIFKYYFDNIRTADLSFYLLDLDKGRNYPNSLFNALSYRELETIGFKILNINDVVFTEYEKKCNSEVNKNNLRFPSMSKFLRDISYISDQNRGNNPSFLQCKEMEVLGENGDSSYITERYTYIFKSLSAQQYDSLLRCWCLKILAEQENTDIDFKLGKQYFAYESDEKKVASELSNPVKEIFDLANLNIEYTTNEQFMDEKKKSDKEYLRYRDIKRIRNQVLFRNNVRKRGIPLECAICGEYDINLLEAAHLWEVKNIKRSSIKEINEFIKLNNLSEIIESSSEYSREIFYKKYYLANSGDNGVWLCKNHHKLFDSNYFCFDSECGKILLKFPTAEAALRFSDELKDKCLSDETLSTLTKSFLKQRQLTFNL